MQNEEIALVKYRIEKSHQTLRAAEKLYDEKFYNSFINRAYYSCYYVVSAALFLKGLSSGSYSFIQSSFY